MHGAINRAQSSINQGILEIENLLEECKKNIQAKSFPLTHASFVEACHKVNVLKLDILILNENTDTENAGVVAESLLSFAMLSVSFRDIYREFIKVYLPDYKVSFEKIDEKFKSTLFKIKQGVLPFDTESIGTSTISKSIWAVRTTESEKMHAFSDVNGQICTIYGYLKESKEKFEFGVEKAGLKFFFKASLSLLFAILSFELAPTDNPKTMREKLCDFENLKSDFVDVYEILGQSLKGFPDKKSEKLAIAGKYFGKVMTEIEAMLLFKRNAVPACSRTVFFKGVEEPVLPAAPSPS